MRKKSRVILWMSAGVVLLFAALPVAVWSQDMPKPSAPLIPRITSADQLVPFAKIIVQRDYIGQRLGWSIKGGERVLLQTTSNVHPWVNEAFVKALRELNCLVDVAIRDASRQGTPEDQTANFVRQMEQRLALDLNKLPETRFGFGSGHSEAVLSAEAKRYDVVIGPGGRIPGLAGGMPWARPEMLANSGAVYPGDLLDLIDAKTWAVIRNAERVEISDLQGAQASFTWFPDWWQIVEGTHPETRSPGHMSTFNALRPGRSEYAIFAGHLMAHPRGGVIKNTDFKGTISGTVGQWETQVPKITLHHDHGEIVRVEGGGFYGEFWRKILDLTKDIQYPGYPRPGTAWIVEFSIGTNPKIFGPVDVEELRGNPERDLYNLAWGFVRDLAGKVHVGYGSREAAWWCQLTDMPQNHYHVHMFYTNYTVHKRDGKTVKLLDGGRLTVLDDPDVRALAAKYGDPDEMLRMDWVPGMTPNGDRLIPPKAKVVPYEEYVAKLPFKLNDPRLIYRVPSHLAKFYGEDRIRLYDPEEFLSFYRKLGQIPVKRVKLGAGQTKPNNP